MTAPTWHDVAAESEIPDGDVVGRIAGEHPIALYRLSDGLYATDAACTHGNASLCNGFIEDDGEIECPLHQGRFDIRSGKALCEPLEQDLRVHPVRIEGGRVFVQIDAG